MMSAIKSTCIEHRGWQDMIVIRQDFVDLTRCASKPEGDHCAAGILSIFERRTNTELSHIEATKEQLEGGLWFSCPAYNIRSGMMGHYSESTIERSVDLLVKLEVVEERQAAIGKVKEYRLKIKTINGLLHGDLKRNFTDGNISPSVTPSVTPGVILRMGNDGHDIGTRAGARSEEIEEEDLKPDSLASLENQTPSMKAETEPESSATLDIDPKTGKPFVMGPTEPSWKNRPPKAKKGRRVGLASRIAQNSGFLPSSDPPRIESLVSRLPAIQSPGTPRPSPPPPIRQVQFQEIWDAYPGSGRINRKEAFVAYCSALDAAEDPVALHQRIMDRIEEFWEPSAKWKGGKYIAALKKWIENECWEEEPEPAEEEDEGPHYPTVDELLKANGIS